MGKLIMVKCNDCGFLKDDYQFGFTASYFQVQKHLIALIRSGQYGYTWKSLLAADPTLKVDASFQLYQCPCCKQLVNTHCLNLYQYAKGFYAPSSDEVLYFYKHLCPTCKKRMISIETHCPKCGKSAMVKPCGSFDWFFVLFFSGVSPKVDFIHHIDSQLFLFTILKRQRNKKYHTKFHSFSQLI